MAEQILLNTTNQATPATPEAETGSDQQSTTSTTDAQPGTNAAYTYGTDAQTPLPLNYPTATSMIPPALAGVWLILLPILLVAVLIQSLALWRAARNNQKTWFGVMLFVQSAGILPILYLIFFKKDKNKEAQVTPPTVTT